MSGCFLAWTLLAASPSAGQAPKIPFEHVTARDGLSRSAVFAVVQDRQGFVWFGTGDGLNRYDGRAFRVFKHHPRDPESLSPGTVSVLLEDRDGLLWIGMESGGLNRFDPSRESFTRYRHDPGDPTSLGHDDVDALAKDRSGGLWIGTRGGLDRFAPAGGRFVHYRHDPDESASLAAGGVHAILEDRSGRLWIGTGAGLDRFDPFQERFHHYPRDHGVSVLLEDRAGILWLGTEGGGLHRFDPSREEFTRYRHDPADPASLGGDQVRTLHQDRPGTLWIGLKDGGLNRFEPSRERFLRYRHDPRDEASLADDDVYAIYEERSGALWVATWGGADRFDPARARFVPYRHDPGDPKSLTDSDASALYEDRSGALWVGTARGLNRYDPAREGFVHYRHDPRDPASLSHDTISAIAEDAAGDLWIATLDGGLHRFDPATARFTPYRHDPQDPASLSADHVTSLVYDSLGNLWAGTWNGFNRFEAADESFARYRLSHDQVTSIFEDRAGKLWIATWGGGVDRFDPATGSFANFRHDAEDPASLSQDFVSSVREALSGKTWIGTRGGGLNRFDPQTERFTRFTEADGFPNNVVYGILEDGLGRLWISTNAGLVRFDPATETWMTYTVRDGLQGNELNRGSYHLGRSGTMYFGGKNGVSAFRPERFLDNPYVPPIVLTSFKLFEREVDWGRAVSYLEEVELGHREGFFSFEIAALSLTRPEKNQYAYRLEGFDEDWIESGTRRYASYTNVPPGEYVLRLRGSNNDGVWNQEGSSLRIVVRLPLWRTWWAYALYLVTLGAAIWGYSRFERRRIGRERTINQRLSELNQLQDSFLANVSHGLRTPIQSLASLSESIAESIPDNKLPEEARDDLSLLVWSSRRLSRLVDDIVDVSELRSKRLALNRRPVDLHAVAEAALNLTRPMLADKGLELRNAVDPGLPPVEADESRLLQILLGLLEKTVARAGPGTIEVGARVKEEEIEVHVKPAGAAGEGPPPAPSGASAPAGDLDLAISRQLVELHGGRFHAEPEGGLSLSFTVRRSARESAVSTAAGGAATLDATGLAVASPPPTSGEGSRILIVDDDPVNRIVLVRQLASEGYRATSVGSGEEGLRLATEGSFDLVLLDVMMPGMSGYDVCRKLRHHFAVPELPVIFLTARSQLPDRVTGFAAGGSDYLVKPVAKDELLARVKVHLDLVFIHRNLELLLHERKTQITQRELLIDELETKNAELERFNYTMSHDLRSPLVTIKGFLGLLRHDAAAGAVEGLEENIERISAAADQMQRLLEDLLEFSRLGRTAGAMMEVRLGELAREAAALLAPQIAERGVEIEIADDLPVVTGDRARLRILWQHLLDNAVKFLGDARSPRVEISCRQGGTALLCSVRDNGIGVEARYHEKIFGLFERLDPDTGGTGMGLALAKRIVEFHGGRIWVESQGRGRGSTFQFTLPRRPAGRSA